MAFDSLRLLSTRGKHTLRREGPIRFFKRGVLFVMGVQYENVYIYENTLHGPEFAPRVQNVTVKIISMPRQLDDLAAEGFDFSYYPRTLLKKKVSRGAVAFCAFVGKDFAHITYAAIKPEAKREADPLPFVVNFERDEACSGFSETNPRYRRMGIYVHVYSCIFRFLREQGRSLDRFTIRKSNLASHSALTKLGSRIVAEARYLRLFHLKFWKEMPIKEVS